jgi:hypothetical protein
LRQVLSENPDMDVGGGQPPVRVFLALIDGNFAEAEQVLAASSREDFQDAIDLMPVSKDIYDGAFSS